LSRPRYSKSQPVRSVSRAAELTGYARVAVAAVALLAPTGLPRSLGADSGTARRSGWLVRMFAAREAALGAGGAWAARTGADLRPWLLAQALGDGADAIAIALATRQGHLGRWRGGALAVFAAAGAIADLGSAAAIGGRHGSLGRTR
jgi:hypothetical protein